MTTTLTLSTNGPYVTTVKNSKTGRVLAVNGPGTNVQVQVPFAHGEINHLVIEEREATQSERDLYSMGEQSRNAIQTRNFNEMRRLNGEDQETI